MLFRSVLQRGFEEEETGIVFLLLISCVDSFYFRIFDSEKQLKSRIIEVISFLYWKNSFYFFDYDSTAINPIINGSFRQMRVQAWME